MIEHNQVVVSNEACGEQSDQQEASSQVQTGMEGAEQTVNENDEKQCDESSQNASAEEKIGEIHQECVDSDFDGYVIVCNSENIDQCTKLELPVDEDGFLPLATLSHSFPRAIGLKFKNPSTGVFRTLAVNDEAKKIQPPKNGWTKNCYVAIFSDELQSAERQKRPNDDDGEDSNSLDKRAILEASMTDVPVDLIVRNISFDTSQETLENYFRQYGEVVFAEIKRDYRTGRPKGFGFIKMKNVADQTKVLEIRDHLIDGRVTQVKIPLHTPESQNKSGRPSYSLPTKLHVGRVPATMTEGELFKAFNDEAKKISENGRVDRVFLMPRRGFAFVSFNDPNVTAQLAKVRDFVVNGVSVCVTIPTPRKHDHDPPPRKIMDPFATGYGSNGYGASVHGSMGGRGGFLPQKRRRRDFNDSWL